VETDKIIFQTKPKPFIEKIRVSFLVYTCLGILIYIIKHSLILATAPLLIFITEFVKVESQFDAWEIKEDEIILFCSGFIKMKTKGLKFHDIRYIDYSESSRYNRQGLTFDIPNQKVRCVTYVNIFRLVDTLKYLKSKGIRITLWRIDPKIQLYLDDND